MPGDAGAKTATAQLFFDHAASELFRLNHGPLAGLRHRTVIERRDGSASLALWQEEHQPGFEVPLHLHDCEEIITVIEGEIEATIDETTLLVGPMQSILIPEGRPHGFRVIGAGPMKLLAIFSSCTPGIFRLDGSKTVPPWLGGDSGHLNAPA